MKKLSKQIKCPYCGFETESQNTKGRTRCSKCKKNFIFDKELWIQYCKKYSDEHPYTREKYEKWIKPRRRKLKFKRVQEAGGKCERCGYNKCLDVFHFHHKDPTKKRNNVPPDWTRIKGFKREDYLLLCANCHIEVHFNEKVI